MNLHDGKKKPLDTLFYYGKPSIKITDGCGHLHAEILYDSMNEHRNDVVRECIDQNSEAVTEA